MIIAYGTELGVVRRAIGNEEIIERLIYALVNEGARILEEVIALRASDIDLVYLTGYGFQLYRGGPMVYASCVDLAKVLLPAQRFTIASNGHAWHVALLLQKLADEGKAF